MKLQTAIFHTFLFVLFLELIGIWPLLILDKIEDINFIKALYFINSFITLTLLILIFKSLKQSDLFKFNKTEPSYYFIAMLLGIGFVFFQSVLNIIYYQEISFKYDFTLENLSSLSVIASIIFVPITEELFFRNYLLRRLLDDYKPIKAIIISSLLFAFIHIPFASLFFDFKDFSLHHAYIVLFGGLIAGILFYKFKSIIPSIIFHIFWNLTSYVL